MLNSNSSPNQNWYPNFLSSKSLKILLILILFINFAVKMIYCWAPLPVILSSVTFDDTFYFLKVARNIALDHRVSFDGIEMTNGFQPLWEILLVPIMYLIKDLRTALSLSLTLSSVLSIGTLLFLYKIVKTLCNERAAFLAVIIWSTNVGLIRMETSGMEFSLSCFMLSWIIYFYIKHFGMKEESISKNYRLLGFLSGFVILARTDAIFIIPSFLIFILFQKKDKFKKTLSFTISSSIVLAPYFIWNLVCFGHIMPISGAVKERMSNKIIEQTYNGYFNLSYIEKYISYYFWQGFLDITGTYNIYLIRLENFLPFLGKNLDALP